MQWMKPVIWTSVALLGLAFVVATPASADFLILDDLIVDGSACIGFDCVNGESFGFDTLRLKENNLRIKFQDTSVSASFPSNDWQLTANDSANGGLNKFSIDDIDGGRTPFTIEAGAPSHSLYVDDGGRIGLGTSIPVVDLHVVAGDTPTLRLEQDGSSGFAPQTWDVAGNETNYFIRDVTNGSTLPFRIRPGAPTSSIDIATDGDVGIGTASPDAQLHVIGGLLVDNVDGGTPTNPAPLYVREAAATGNTVVAHLEKITGSPILRFESEFRTWDFTGGNLFSINDPSVIGTEMLLDSGGNLTISGSLVTGTAGSCTAATPCDGVFLPEFELESIEDHAAYMWDRHHLAGVGPTRPNEPINITRKTTGILNELEKAHIYIEQLHQRLAALEAKLTDEL